MESDLRETPRVESSTAKGFRREREKKEERERESSPSVEVRNVIKRVTRFILEGIVGNHDMV